MRLVLLKKISSFFFDNMIKLNAANFLKVFNLYFEDTLASQAYLVNGENEYLLVNFINNKKCLKYNSSSIILDYIFQKSISNKNFNFHGSMISSIANFYKDRKSTRLNSSHLKLSRMPSSA